MSLTRKNILAEIKEGINESDLLLLEEDEMDTLAEQLTSKIVNLLQNHEESIEGLFDIDAHDNAETFAVVTDSLKY